MEISGNLRKTVDWIKTNKFEVLFYFVEFIEEINGSIFLSKEYSDTKHQAPNTKSESFQNINSLKILVW